MHYLLCVLTPVLQRVYFWLSATAVLTFAMLLGASPSAPQIGSPVFSTQTPESGLVGGTFDILLPLVNTGTAPADAVTITSVVFGKTLQTNLVLPLLLGSLEQNGPHQLVLQFDASSFIVGGNYLFTLRGTYQSGNKTAGFAVNRFVRVTSPSQSVENDLKRWIALDALRTEVTSLPHLDKVADAQAILSFLQSRPEFVDSGKYPDSTSIWARFAAGRLPIVIANGDFIPLDDTSRATSIRPHSQARARLDGTPHLQTVAARIAKPTRLAALPMPAQGGGGGAAANLPTSSFVHLMDAVTQFEPDHTVISNLSSWLLAANYVPVVANPTVATLKTIGGEGILFFRSHGIFAPPGSAPNVPVFLLWTSDRADVANTVSHDQDGDVLPDDSPLVLTLAEQSHGVQEFHWAISSYFVRKYWQPFGKNSLIYIDACNSDDPDFKQTVLNNKASVYAGWTQSTGDPWAGRTARLVFDRLLGADKFCPETNPLAFTECVPGKAAQPIFAQRPFGYSSVANTEFQDHNVGTITDINSRHFGLLLKFTQNPGTSFSLLAPSISNLTVDETMGQGGQLTVNGIFGDDPRQTTSGSVTVGGRDANIQSWNSNQIVVDLSLSGGGSAGDVVVTVRGHKGNVARLTEWRGNAFNYTISGNGSLQIQTTFNIHFRADIRKFRPVIHNEPIEPTGATIGAADSDGTYSASGSGPGVGETFQWSGSGSLVGFTPNLPTTGVVLYTTAVQIVDSKNLQAFVGAATEANAGAVCTDIVPNSPSSTSPLAIVGPSNLGPLIGDPGPRSFHFTLDSDARIGQSSFGAQGTGLLRSYFCMDESKSAAYNFTWGPLAPADQTGPNPESAR
jgi:hypothetical protein